MPICPAIAWAAAFSMLKSSRDSISYRFAQMCIWSLTRISCTFIYSCVGSPFKLRNGSTTNLVFRDGANPEVSTDGEIFPINR